MAFALVIILSILLLVYANKYLFAYSPAMIFTLYWVCQILIITIGGYGYFYFTYTGIIYILLCVITFNIGYSLASTDNSKYIHVNRTIIVGYKKNAIKVYYIVLALAWFSVIYKFLSEGHNIGELLNFDSFLTLSNQNSVDRYADEKSTSILQKLLGINDNCCPIIGGLIFYDFKRNRRWLSYISMLPSILYGFIESAKMGVITSVFLWLIGIVLASQLFNIKLHTKANTLLKIIGGFLLFFFILLGIMMFRIGKFDLDTLEIALGKFISYAFGHLPAFDIWFSDYNEDLNDLTLGGKTFYGITNALGIMNREQGVFTDFTTISSHGDITNVYSVFRFFVEDFGVYGTLLLLFIIGFIIRIIYQNFLSRKHLMLNLTLMCFVFFFISWSFATSIFVYTTFIAMIPYMYILVMNIFNVRHRSRIRASIK